MFTASAKAVPGDETGADGPRTPKITSCPRVLTAGALRRVPLAGGREAGAAGGRGGLAGQGRRGIR